MLVPNLVYRSQFLLSRQADPKTIQVTINGVTAKQDPQNGWTYDSTHNSVHFSKSQIPRPGAVIEVQYKSVCLP